MTEPLGLILIAMLRQIFFALLAFTPALAHADLQSVLAPHGENARQIGALAWVMFAGGALIFLAVMALAAAALFGPQALRAVLARRALIVGGGIIFPVVVLTALLVYSLVSVSAMAGSRDPPAARIEVTGELWWWRVRYLDANGNTIMETANEIRIPAGRRVEFRLRSDNVIHSFWIPRLAGKTDMIPGHVNTLQVRADAPGIFRGQCAEYCGAQHANMALYAIALPPPEYAEWLAAQRLPARETVDTFLQHGKQLFLTNECVECHTVRGTSASGNQGPDLTHVGSRHSIAAGIYPNTVGAFAGWISAAQHLKPDNKMPSSGHLTAEELRAIAAYMESLQ